MEVVCLGIQHVEHHSQRLAPGGSARGCRGAPGHWRRRRGACGVTVGEWTEGRHAIVPMVVAALKEAVHGCFRLRRPAGP